MSDAARLEAEKKAELSKLDQSDLATEISQKEAELLALKADLEAQRQEIEEKYKRKAEERSKVREAHGFAGSSGACDCPLERKGTWCDASNDVGDNNELLIFTTLDGRAQYQRCAEAGVRALSCVSMRFMSLFRSFSLCKLSYILLPTHTHTKGRG